MPHPEFPPEFLPGSIRVSTTVANDLISAAGKGDIFTAQFLLFDLNFKQGLGGFG